MTVIAFPKCGTGARTKPSPARVMVGGLSFAVTSAGQRVLAGCLEFEHTDNCLPFHCGTAPAQRLKRQGLVAEAYDMKCRAWGVCLTPLGRAVARQLFCPRPVSGDPVA